MCTSQGCDGAITDTTVTCFTNFDCHGYLTITGFTNIPSGHLKWLPASSSSFQKTAKTTVKAARLGAELKSCGLSDRNHTTERLRRQEDIMKRLSMMKKLAATYTELEAVKRAKEKTFGPRIEE